MNNPPGAAESASIWPLIFPAITLIAFVVLLLSSRRSRMLEPGSGQRAPAWFWAFVVCILGLMGTWVSFAGSPHQPQAAPTGGYWSALIPLLAMVGVFIGLILIRNRGVLLAAWRSRRGDVAGAIADLEKRVARLRPTPPDPALGTDPWAAPTVPVRTPMNERVLADLLNALGALEAKRGDWAKALGWFEQAGQTGGNVWHYRANQGQALGELGRHAEGITLIRDSLGQMPLGAHLIRCQALHQLAGALVAVGELVKARAALTAADVERRQVRFPLNFNNRALREQGRAVAASLHAAEARALTPP